MACALCLSAVAASSPAQVTARVEAQPAGQTIPADFVGLSFGMKTVAGGAFFNATNAQLIAIFRDLGLRHLRLGGTSVEWPARTPIPDEADIDNLFAFVKAAGVRQVIYSFRLLETNADVHYAQTNAALAAYIAGHYQPWLESFAIGNEPDIKRVFSNDCEITNFASYLAKWHRFAGAIANAVPGAKFSGPDAGSGNVNWTARFAAAEKDAGLVSAITEHFYVGGRGRDVEASEGTGAMLSPDWDKRNQALYDEAAVPVAAAGFPFRFTEANDHYSGGVPGASDTFAGALWALDFLHWWAAHGARGVDFHNTQWVVNDVITMDARKSLATSPKAWGIKAFNMGGRGRVAPVNVSNPSGVNLTVYAVRGTNQLFVTVINKEHDANAREAEVTIAAAGVFASGEVIRLVAPAGNVAAKDGISFDKESFRNPVRVPAASAAIIALNTSAE
jgi:hypothetical protein